MENYAYNSYPDSGESSPRSREIDFENTAAPWEDHQQQNYKAKFMCSYGGKIHPRPHDNQLSYIGGETKILAVDRSIKFAVMISKLAALCGDSDVSFKYQLPGEDLDALISVTNDDDLEHLMLEYDRLYRGSGKPARMRLFIFPAAPSPATSFGSDRDRDRFVEALNSGPTSHVEVPKSAPNNVDFLFGFEKGGVVPQNPPAVKVPELPEVVHVGPGHDDRVIGSDHLNLQAQLQRMNIRAHEDQQHMYRKSSDENLVPGGYSGEYYVQKLPEKLPPVTTLPVTMPPPVTTPGYWQEKQVAGAGYQPAPMTATPMDQPVYMIQAPGPVYHHAPAVRPVTGQAGQGYYMQRMGGPPGGEVYREQPVYNVVPPPQQAAPGNMGVVRPSGPVVTDTGYTQVAYDSAVGRQVFYTAPGGVVQQPPPVVAAGQYQGVGGGVAVSGEMRGVGGPLPLGQDGKVVNKTSM